MRPLGKTVYTKFYEVGGNDQTGFTLNSNITDDYIFCIPSNKWKLIEFIDMQTMSMIYQVNLTSPETISTVMRMMEKITTSHLKFLQSKQRVNNCQI